MSSLDLRKSHNHDSNPWSCLMFADLLAHHAWWDVKAFNSRKRRWGSQTPRRCCVRSQHPGNRHPGHWRLLPLTGQEAGGLWLPSSGGKSDPHTLCSSVPGGDRGDTRTPCVIGVFVSFLLEMIIHHLFPTKGNYFCYHDYIIDWG